VQNSAEADRRGPRRRCLATGESGERSALLRFVVGPGGEIVPDVAARLPGRGLWLTPRRDIVERAIGLARRAGRAVGGFEKVREAAAGGKAGLLLFALEGAPDARRKIGALGGDLPLVRVLTAAELGAAFGRDHVVHAALWRGPLCTRLLADAARIAGFRAGAAVEQAREPAPARLRAAEPPDGQDQGIGVR
jgi:predicted RNA-binding protein YlxR (DUF448 family)